jgi:hypothetical protein
MRDKDEQAEDMTNSMETLDNNTTKETKAGKSETCRADVNLDRDVIATS